MKKYSVLLIFACFFVMGLALFEYVRFSDGKLHVIFCDVGQGDAIVIRTPRGKTILFDGGPDEQVISCMNRHMPFWNRTVHVMLLSHPHLDHFFGLSAVMKRYSVQSFATEQLANQSHDFQLLASQLENEHMPQRTVLAGDSFVLPDGVALHIVGPTQKYLQQTSDDGFINEKAEFASLIVKVSYGTFDLLLTGDSQVAGLQQVHRSGLSGIDVLQVPHHGSVSGLDQEILTIIRPKVAVISVGKNRYGHPTNSILKLLRDNQITIARTDQQGDVEIIADQQSWFVR